MSLEIPMSLMTHRYKEEVTKVFIYTEALPSFNLHHTHDQMREFQIMNRINRNTKAHEIAKLNLLFTTHSLLSVVLSLTLLALKEKIRKSEEFLHSSKYGMRPQGHCCILSCRYLCENERVSVEH